jgi:Ca2+-binding RTX toxin-like protein
VIGGSGNDAITGNDAAVNWFWPGLGDDTVDGAGGDDFIAYDNQGAAITLTFTSPGTGTATGMGTDSFTNVERAVGGNANDTFTGSSGDEVLRGGPGNDSLNGAGGTDWVDYFTATSGVTVDLATNRASGGHGDDTLAGFENISGSNTAADDLLGNATANWIVARGGNDWLVGEGGADTLDGGAGNDWIGYLNAGGPVTVNLGAGTVSGADGSDSLLGIEGVYGSAFNDSLVGGSALVADEFDGQAGNDTIDGGAVTDRANYANLNRLWFKSATQGVVVDLGGITGDGSVGQGTAQDGQGGTDVLRNINFVVGTSFDDSIAGSSAQVFEFFEGGEGDDTIDGGAIGATDALALRNGNRVVYANAGGPVQVDLAAGTATGDDGSDTLLNITQVQGSRYNDTLLGSSSSIPEQFRPGSGADSVDGRGGEDWIRFDDGGATQGVSLTLRADSGPIIVTDQLGNADTLTGIEHVRGSGLADSLVGSARTDLIERFQGARQRHHRRCGRPGLGDLRRRQRRRQRHAGWHGQRRPGWHRHLAQHRAGAWQPVQRHLDRQRRHHAGGAGRQRRQ